ncbi:MAG: SDR family oxidoreductase, partial [Pseudomonadota bacterium]
MVAQKRVLLAGVTGFLGKVVLSELMRRREELGVDRVFVLVRSTRNRTAESRFAREVANSTCFASLHPEWVDYVSVVSGELTSPNIDLEEGALAELCAQLTHVIHCAATVEFDLSLEEATDTNVTGSLNILELAKRCPRLHSMISCSTCYAVPLPTDGSAIQEKLADLPFSAEAAYRDILAGRADQAALLAQSGLPNTYTLSKCLKEHMMAARQGSVPL